MAVNRSGLIALAFPSYNPGSKFRAKDSQRRANHFGLPRSLGESVVVAENTYGYIVPASSPMPFMSAAKTAGGKIIPLKAKADGSFEQPAQQEEPTPEKDESGEHLVGGSVDPKNKDMGKKTAGEKGSMANSGEYGKTMPISEGTWVKVESSLDAVRFTMQGTTPIESVQGEIHEGFYYVMGINEAAGVATLSKHKVVKEYLYNIDLDKVGFGEKSASVEEAAQYTTKRYKTIMGAYTKLASQLKAIKGKPGQGSSKDALQAKMRKARVLAHTLNAAKNNMRGDTRRRDDKGNKVEKDEGSVIATPPKQLKNADGGVVKEQARIVSQGAKVNPKTAGGTKTATAPVQEAKPTKPAKLTTESVHAHGLRILNMMKAKGFKADMKSSTASKVFADNREAMAAAPTKSVEVTQAKPLTEAQLETLMAGGAKTVKTPVQIGNDLQSAMAAFRTSMINGAQQAITPQVARSLAEDQDKGAMGGVVGVDPEDFARSMAEQAGEEAPVATEVETEEPVKDEQPETTVVDTTEKESDVFTAKAEDTIPGDWTGNVVTVLKSRGYKNAEQIAAAISEGKPAEAWFNLTGGSLQDAKRLGWELRKRQNGTI